MANYAYFTVTKPRGSMGDERIIHGTITLVADGSNYNSLNDTTSDVTGGGAGVTTPGLGGIDIRFDVNAASTDLVSSESALLRRLNFDSKITAFMLTQPLTTSLAAENVDNQAAAYQGAVKYGDAYCKLQLITTGVATAENAQAEPDDTAVLAGTYTAPFIAIGV